MERGQYHLRNSTGLECNLVFFILVLFSYWSDRNAETTETVPGGKKQSRTGQAKLQRYTPQGRQPRKVSIYAARRGRGTARYYLSAQFVAFTSRIPPYLIRPRRLCRSLLQAMENTLLFSCEGKQPFLRFGRLETVSSTCRIRCFANLSAKEVRVRVTVTHQRQSKSIVDVPFGSTIYLPRQEEQKKYGSSCSSMQFLLLLSISFVLQSAFTFHSISFFSGLEEPLSSSDTISRCRRSHYLGAKSVKGEKIVKG